MTAHRNSRKRGGKKETMDLHLSQACRRYATQSSTSFFDRPTHPSATARRYVLGEAEIPEA
jgi:hypothetical protein